jgi:predicted phage baseplate assembly protein
MNDAGCVPLAALNDCGCCEGISAQTPVQISNRPGLQAIAYRIGTHARFKASMLAALSSSAQHWQLRGLSSEDAHAVVLALQGLRTRDDDDLGIALLDAWATVADILTFYQERIANESYLRTATERISLLELARLIGYELRPAVAASTYLAFTLEDATGAPAQTTIDVGVKVQSVPGPGQKPQTFETVEAIDARPEWNALTPQLTQPHSIQRGVTQLYLTGTTTQLQAGDAILIVGDERSGYKSSNQWDFRLLQSVTPIPDKRHTLVTWAKGLGATHGSPTASNPQVFALRQRAGFFGSNAPDWRTMPDAIRKAFVSGYDPTKPATDPGEWPDLTVQSGATIGLDAEYSKVVKDSWVVFSSPQAPIKTGSIELYRVSSVSPISCTDFTLNAKVTELTLDISVDGNEFKRRETRVFAQSEPLALDDEPVTAPIGGQVIPLDGLVPGLQPGRTVIVSGKSAIGDGSPMTQVATIQAVSADASRTTITLKEGLRSAYQRSTTTIYANVAPATAGETVQEVLGSGDASHQFQQFTLRQSPLTYVPAQTPSGAESTLELYIDNVEWHEAPVLYNHGPHDRIFVTRTGDDDKTTVEFGDGQTGALLPSGQENVTAIYRKGSGSEGLLTAGKLSLLMTRPLGVNSVTNPEVTSGAKDRDRREDARINAPLTVLTLDRIVSLQDYEDFARAYAGIAKALATWTWNGQVRGVFLTVAGPNGEVLPPDDRHLGNLVSSLQQNGDPYIPLRVQSYRPAMFRLAARVSVDPDRRQTDVLPEVEGALRTHFSFDMRSFGQPVTLAEVLAAMQRVPGVVGADVYKLYRTGESATLNHRLLAATPQVGPGTVAPAELLTLDPVPLDDLGVML